MAANPVVSNLFVRTALDAALALFNAGGAGVVKIFTGSAPVSCETADAGSLLATFNMNATGFAASVDNTAGGATATANAITGVAATGTGTAGYFRAYPHTPSTTNALDQGTIGTSAADMIINTTTINSGDPLAITSWTVTLPDGSGVD